MPEEGAMLLLEMGEKLRLHCRKCGLRRQYDVRQLASRIGNVRVPSLIEELARRNGCVKWPAPAISDRCGFHLVLDSSNPDWIASRPAP